MQQAQEDDQSIATVLSWVKNGKQPHRWVIQGQSRDISVLWNNFTSLNVVNDNFCEVLRIPAQAKVFYNKSFQQHCDPIF